MKMINFISPMLTITIAIGLYIPCFGLQKLKFWKKNQNYKCLSTKKKKTCNFLDILLKNKKSCGFATLSIALFSLGTCVSYKIKKMIDEARNIAIKRKMVKLPGFNKYYVEDIEKGCIGKKLPQDKNAKQHTLKKRIKLWEDAKKAYLKKQTGHLTDYPIMLPATIFLGYLGMAYLAYKKAYNSFKV